MISKLLNSAMGAPISFVHEFHRPPYGGGNQFLLALLDAFNRLGYSAASMCIGRRTKAVLFNSFNFDMDNLRHVLRNRHDSGIRTLHRVDGPIAAYRGSGIEIDRAIFKINCDLADVSVFQSRYSLEKHRELGLHFGNSHVISNAVNPAIFNSSMRIAFPKKNGRRIRIVATSWSSNPRKGQHTYEWLDKNLNFEKFDMQFVGNINSNFQNIVNCPPLPSRQLANVLRESDIYITASENDPCSNALIEALSCGLPALFKNSGGHPEIVGAAGLGFDDKEQIPTLLEKIVDNYEEFQAKISVPHIDEVARRYLSLLVK